MLEGVRWLKRDVFYDLDTTSPNKMHQSFCEKVEADVYVISHATAPFTTVESIDTCINKVLSGVYDSAVLGTEIKKFLYRDNIPFNFSLDNVPRTQDLEPLYEEVNGAYVFSKNVMNQYHSRTGGRIYIHSIGKIEGMDIDDPEDFDIADAIYMKQKKEGK